MSPSAALARAIPHGRTLDAARFERRHRALTTLVLLHAVVLPIVAVASTGQPVAHALLEGAVLVALAGCASARTGLPSRARGAILTVALMSASALVVHVSGGLTEAHFHFFIVVALLGLYEDWLPFGIGLAYVLVHHGILGTVDPDSVLAGHAGDDAWKWAAVHSVYIAAAGVAGVLTWQLNSDVRDAERRGEERYANLVESVSQVIFQADADGRWTFLNRAWEELTGTPARAVLGTPVADWVHAEDRDEVTRLLALTDGRARADVRHEAEGETRWIEVRVHPAPEGGGVYGTLTDVTEQRHAEQALSHQALHDPLTGLPNRALFLDRLRHALAHAADDELTAVLFLDVDGFKAINDEHGHEHGDALLRQVAAILAEETRVHDVASRFGGDEFAVLCVGLADEGEARDVAERLLGRFRGTGPTSSIGIASGRRGAVAESLLRDADAAMYRAKQRGRNLCVVFDQSMRTSALDALELESELRTALARRELELHYQPVFGLEEGGGTRLRGVEALLRWNHPERGSIAPCDFIPIAEQSGLIVPIGEWVVDEACAELARWRDALPAGTDLPGMGINVSARQLRDPGLVQHVADALAFHGLEGKELQLEITETVLVGDDHRTAATLDGLHALGCRLVLDDFGTGFSSLIHLKRFPLRAVKIDRAFVAGLPDDASDEAIVHAVIGMARGLGLIVVAEGVESAAQLQRLTELGCTHAQGFFLGRPSPAAAAREHVLAQVAARDQRSAAGQTIR